MLAKFAKFATSEQRGPIAFGEHSFVAKRDRLVIWRDHIGTRDFERDWTMILVQFPPTKGRRGIDYMGLQSQQLVLPQRKQEQLVSWFALAQQAMKHETLGRKPEVGVGSSRGNKQSESDSPILSEGELSSSASTRVNGGAEYRKIVRFKHNPRIIPHPWFQLLSEGTRFYSQNSEKQPRDKLQGLTTGYVEAAKEEPKASTEEGSGTGVTRRKPVTKAKKRLMVVAGK